MKTQLLTIFPDCIEQAHLQEETAAYFEIFDDEATGCQILFEENAGHFKVENPKQKSLGFVKIDGCLLPSTEHRKADFAIFDETCFCIADIKDAKKKNRQYARGEAYEQLVSTMQVFLEKGIDFSDYQVEAIIALTFRKSYPAATSRMQDKVIAFFDEFGADLLEGNSKRFE